MEGISCETEWERIAVEAGELGRFGAERLIGDRIVDLREEVVELVVSGREKEFDLERSLEVGSLRGARAMRPLDDTE